MPRGERHPIHEMEQGSFVSLEHWIEHVFQRQYEIQAKIMPKTGDLELLPDAEEMGILGMDGKEYPIPSMEALVHELTWYTSTIRRQSSRDKRFELHSKKLAKKKKYR